MSAKANLKNIFPGNSNMAQQMRAFDWTKNELGPPEAWPEALKISIRIILTSHYPMFIWWGENLINLHNDGYASLVHSKHREALGMPASILWEEFWDTILTRIEFIKKHDTGSFDETIPFINFHRKHPEITYATFSYSPILNDMGQFGGVICPVFEKTEFIFSQRQMTLLRALSEKNLPIQSRQEFYTLLAEVLHSNLDDIPFALLYELDIEAGVASLKTVTGLSPETPATPKILPLHAESIWPLREVLAIENVSRSSSYNTRSVSSQAGHDSTIWACC